MEERLVLASLLKMNHVMVKVVQVGPPFAFFSELNGGWTDWSDWGMCSATCGSGTRSRTRLCTNPSPSNGGESCPNNPSETTVCNVQTCIPGTYNGNYFVSTSQVTWDEAKVACEGMSRQLVIIDNQAEQDFLESVITSFHHWIGMRCQNGMNCAWVDGRNMESGFINWAPEEPKDRDCVWIGWYVNKWDDDFCDVLHEFVFDGAWSAWTDWGSCTVTCGGGTRTRMRTCTNPAPSNGGAICPDQSIENELCNGHACPAMNRRDFGKQSRCYKIV
ncbi:coadhesin-like [Mercenaria mercenaria]|uniref:coadhesin-like n=1 Tax=Mercenaria mercenaria TaxID=6596 RepID=UPI00234E7C75|nr:coadhesin-like [Mercenaria mercenaria]